MSRHPARKTPFVGAPRARTTKPAKGAAAALRPVRAVDRALSILTCLGEGDRRLVDLSRSSKLHKATVTRLLASLLQAEMVTRNDHGVYTLGPAIGALARRLTNGHRTLIDVLRDPMRRMWQVTQETICVHMLVGLSRTCVEEIQSPHAVRYHGGIGQRMPLHAGSAGRILLAFLPPHERAEVFDGPGFGKLTEGTITNRRRLEAQLEQDRRLGYAISLGEVFPGAAGVSVPVFDTTGKLVASVSVHGPATRLTPAALRRYAAILLKEIPVIPHAVV